MNVETIRSTPRPEKLAAQAARGDYYDGFIADVDYSELLSSVEYDDRHRDAVLDIADVIDTDGCVFVVGNVIATDDPSDNPNPEDMYRQYALLERLFRRGHWGPFEHPQITIGVEGVSRSCMAQITRHRHASFDVQSQRYVDFSEKDDSVEVPKSLVDPDHATRGEGVVDVDDREMREHEFEQLSDELVDTYEELVDAGVPKEDARFILPIGTKVNFTVSVNARMLLHIEDMRNTGEAQWEIREMTQRIHDEFEQWMPMTAHLYEEHGPHKLAP